MNSPYFEEVADSLVIPFGVAEKTPVYPGCEGLSKKENISCFTTKVSEFVMNNFDKKVANSQNLSGNHKIKIAFVISRSGEVSDVTASTSNSALAKEAERIVNLLPRMTPAQHSGKNVAVPFILPVLLNME
ncbi:MAG: energy transducer TonB [Flavobacteriaceae bacterium]|nr:energy transducer TonB [Flavobacteriaceae bacterium]